jgi:hypothetical protein
MQKLRKLPRLAELNHLGSHSAMVFCILICLLWQGFMHKALEGWTSMDFHAIRCQSNCSSQWRKARVCCLTSTELIHIPLSQIQSDFYLVKGAVSSAEHQDIACRIVDRDGALLDMPATSLYDSMTLMKTVTTLQERLDRKPTVKEMAKAVSRTDFLYWASLGSTQIQKGLSCPGQKPS